MEIRKLLGNNSLGYRLGNWYAVRQAWHAGCEINQHQGLVASPKRLTDESLSSSHSRPIPNAHGARLVASPSQAPCGISFYGLISALAREIEINR